MRIVGVLLAAGRGTRFGGGKLGAALPQAAHGVPAGTPVGVASARHLLAALDEVVAVVRPGDCGLAGGLAAAGARIVPCAQADDGMGSSLACGVAAVRDADGWLVALGDMPWIAPATVAALAAALRAGSEIVAPVYRGQRGHPVGFAARYAAALASLHGDEGARAVLREHRDAIHLVAVDDPGVLGDVDRQEDLLRAP